MLAYALVSKACSEATNTMNSLYFLTVMVPISTFLTYFCKKRLKLLENQIKEGDLGASIQSTATKVIYLNYPAPGFCLLQPKRNKSHKQGNSPTKPIDRLQKSLYNSSVLTYFILRVKNRGGEDNEVFY